MSTGYKILSVILGILMIVSGIIVSFDIESEGFQAITELKQNVLKDGYAVSQAALVKNTDGHVTSLDSFDTGIETKNDTRMGGLIGALLGVAGGPLGMVLIRIRNARKELNARR